MKSINFLFAIHCHQPVGNFEGVIEDAYEKSYLPFINVLKKFPDIKMTLHYTGILLSYFKEKHPEFLVLLKELVDRGQVEIMTGGYYEPIIPVIPKEDVMSQIQKQTRFTRDELGYDPKGLWLAERVWEPQLAELLNDVGVKYVALDDYHFVSAGLDESDLNGYYFTEDKGKTLAVFPISKKLRYLMPFRLVHETIDHLREIATESGDLAAVIADDGEKFGIWPGTFKWVFEEKWLENFFSALTAESAWINTMTFSQYMKKFPAKGRIYIPTASYFEMMEWSLMTSAGKKFDNISGELKRSGKLEYYKEFFKGGFWRNFFVKYPESNNMHKKMLLVSEKVQKISSRASNTSKITDELMMGQCNCAYWHGVFGGLYLNYLRHAIYEHLIRAENMADEILKGHDRWLDVDIRDFDKDGSQEILVSSKIFNLYFSPKDGGSLFEMDLRSKCFNLMNNMTRREEVYHKDVLRSHSHQLTLSGTTNGAASIHDVVRVKEVGLENYLNYDWYRRASFIDHFFGNDVTIEKFAACKYNEAGDFVNTPFEHKVNYGKAHVDIDLHRKGQVRVNAHSIPVKVHKQFSINASSGEMDVTYTIENLSKDKAELWFGSEINLSLLAGNAPDRYYLINGEKPQDPALISTGISKDIYEVKIIDKWSGISIILEGSRKFDLWRFPIETVSQSEGGFEKTFQNSCILVNFKISLPAMGKDLFKIKFIVREGER